MRFPAWVLAISALLFASQPVAAQTPAPTFSSLSQQAQTARDAHQLDKALDLYKKALKLKPNWEEGLGNVGSIAYDLDQYKDCVWAFNKLSESKPDATPAWTMAGLCEYKLRNYGSALDDFTQVEKLGYNENPELARAARLHYALMLTKAGRFEKAIVVLTELTRIDKKTPEISAAAGIAGLRRPWVPAEVPEAERDLVYRLGDAMTTAMELDYKAANQKCDELLQAYPSEPNVHFRCGAFLYVQDGDRGVEEIKKTVALDPDHVPALVSLSAISLKRDDPEGRGGIRRTGREGRPHRFLHACGSRPGSDCQRGSGTRRHRAAAGRETGSQRPGCALQSCHGVQPPRPKRRRRARAERIQTA